MDRGSEIQLHTVVGAKQSGKKLTELKQMSNACKYIIIIENNLVNNMILQNADLHTAILLCGVDKRNPGC